MSKLAPPVETALAMWRARTGHGTTPDTSRAGGEIVVVVTFEGDPQPLREAGLATGYDRGGVVSGRIAFGDLERLAAVPSVVYIEMQPDVRPTLDGTVAEMKVPWKVPPDTPWPGKGAGVIVAVVDTGIDIFHESFRKSDGKTRILELWDQSASTGGSAPPSIFQQIGRVYSQAQIDAGITAGPPFASVDPNGHGTHVAGIAAGNGRQDDRCSFPGRYVGVAPEADLVVVKAIALPPGSRSNAGDGVSWASGIRARTTLNGAITDAATSITVSAAAGFPTSGSYHLRIGAERLRVTAGQGTPTWTVTRGVDGTTAAAHANGDTVEQVADKPVVVNCSFGTSVGPHDGTGALDRIVDEVLRPADGAFPGLAIVCSAGNEGDSEIHESGIIPASPGSTTVSFTIPSGSKEDDELDIWYNGTATLDLTLTAPPNPAQPGPNSIGPIAPGAAGSPFTIGGMTVAVSSATTPSALHSNQKEISVRIGVVARTTLNGAITAAATSITVNSFTGFPTSGNYRISIGAEKLLVTGGQGTLTWTVTRGVDGTTASAHANFDTVEQISDLTIRPGPWQITLANTSGVAASWRAWFRSGHGDPYPTFHMDGESGLVERRRVDTIGEPGSSVNAITVANYSDGDGLISSDSSRGGALPTQQQWQPSTAYVLRARVIPAATPTGFSYRCTTAGTSGATEPTFPTTVGQTVNDGTVVWECVSALVHELKPTVAAPGSGVAAARSRDDPDSNSSCCDQLVVDKSGTSMSSPHVAGLVALMLEKNRTLTFEALRGHLQRTTRIDGIPSAEVPQVFDPLLNIRAGQIWGSGKVNAAAALADMPAMGGGGGGGPFPFVSLNEAEWGYTPHTVFSRLGEWNRRYGPRPGLMLMAALLSEHFDEVLRLINHNRRVGTVWRREGGPVLARHLLFHHGSPTSLLPAALEGCDVRTLIRRFLPILERFGGTRLKQDVRRYASFAQSWPGAGVQSLDEVALALRGKP